VVGDPSAASLAQAIESIVDEPRDRLRAAATETAAPYLAEAVLRRIYEDSRLLAAGRSAEAAAVGEPGSG
jgi:hypothetical protein